MILSGFIYDSHGQLTMSDPCASCMNHNHLPAYYMESVIFHAGPLNNSLCLGLCVCHPIGEVSSYGTVYGHDLVYLSDLDTCLELVSCHDSFLPFPQ